MMQHSRRTQTKKHDSSLSTTFKGNAMMKIEKEKTVMCENILRSRYCSHGKACKFAHSKQELRTETYAQANLWGLCKNTYRSRPCFDFVATGKCPYGSKCNCIHDERIAVKEDELQLVKVQNKQFRDSDAMTDVDVDYFRISRLCEGNYGPLGRGTFSLFSTFDKFKDTVCNIRENQSTGCLTEKQRLHIAVAFYKFRKFENFKFKASHCVYGAFVCMVVQKKHFLLTNDGGVKEVQDVLRNGMLRSDICSVHELAFDQASVGYDSSKPAPALWFNIPDADIKKVTVEDVKKITRKDMDLKRTSSDKKHFIKGKDFFQTYFACTPHYELPFNMFYARLKDPSDAHSLVIQTLLRELGVESTGISLEERFEGVKLALQIDYWPKCKGGTAIPTKYDSVPPVSRLYEFDGMGNKNGQFRSFCCNIKGRNPDKKSRLPVFDVITHNRDDTSHLDNKYHLGKIHFIENLNPYSEWGSVISVHIAKGSYY